MEKSGVTSTEEGKASEKQQQVNVDFFFDQKGIVHKGSVFPGQTVNTAFYVEVSKRLWQNVRPCTQGLFLTSKTKNQA